MTAEQVASDRHAVVRCGAICNRLCTFIFGGGTALRVRTARTRRPRPRFATSELRSRPPHTA